MTKQYLIVDLNSDYKISVDYKGLKEFLIDTIKDDLLMNCSEYEIAKDCTEELEKMAKEDFTQVKWITDLLESYCYKIIDLLDLQRDLEDAKSYFTKNSTVPTVFDIVLDIINKGGVENE